jgi:aminoglycoside phosphotransferase (APT) family kinase protein
VSTLSPAELAGVAAVLQDAGVPLAGPLTAEQIAGGRSNLTFILSDGAGRWVLRTPPRAGRTPSAHDVGREFRITSALHGTGVPVPPPVAFYAEEDILGGPFALAEFVEGVTLQSASQLAELSASLLDAITDELVGTLAALHAVDHVSVGLGDLGRAHGYAERQLRRWAGQWELVGDHALDGLALELSRLLSRRLPGEGRAALVHGDYRIDNTILDLAGPAPRVAAVVDWELSTIGDPVADVALMCAYRAPALDQVLGLESAWASPRLASIEELAAAYERGSGRSLAHWDAHLALACFKIAVIAAGIDHRARASGGTGASAAAAVAPFLRLGLDTLGVTA